MKNDTAFTPYAGGGLGVGFVNMKGDISIPSLYKLHMSDTSTGFVGHLGIGVSYAINDVITADLGYRFMFIEDGKANYSGVTMKAADLQSHQIMLGFRVNF